MGKILIPVVNVRLFYLEIIFGLFELLEKRHYTLERNSRVRSTRKNLQLGDCVTKLFV